MKTNKKFQKAMCTWKPKRTKKLEKKYFKGLVMKKVILSESDRKLALEETKTILTTIYKNTGKK